MENVSIIFSGMHFYMYEKGRICLLVTPAVWRVCVIRDVIVILCVFPIIVMDTALDTNFYITTVPEDHDVNDSDDTTAQWDDDSAIYVEIILKTIIH